MCSVLILVEVNKINKVESECNYKYVHFAQIS